MDETYLEQIGSIYGFESKEYLDQLKVMEDHRKQHTDAIVAEGKRETQRLNEIYNQQSIEDEARMKKRLQESEKIAAETAKAIGDAFRAGLSKGGNAGRALEAFGAGIMKQLGGIFIAMGEKSAAASPALAVIRAGLSNIFTAPEASLAGGLALIALGEALDAIGGGGSSGGGGGGPTGAPSPVTFASSLSLSGTTNSASLTPSITPITPLNVTVIGPNDPVAQRQLTQLMQNASRRNL